MASSSRATELARLLAASRIPNSPLAESLRLAQTLSSAVERIREQSIPFESSIALLREQQRRHDELTKSAARVWEPLHALSARIEEQQRTFEGLEALKVSTQIAEQIRWRDELAQRAASALAPFEALSVRLTSSLAPLLTHHALLRRQTNLAELFRLAWKREIAPHQEIATRLADLSTFSPRLAGITGLVASKLPLPQANVSQLSELVFHELASTIEEAKDSGETLANIDAPNIALRTAERIVSREKQQLPISLESLLQMIVTILVALFATVSAEDDWQKISSQLNELIELQEEYEDDAGAAESRLVVIRPAKLRTEPHGKAHSIAELAENQELLLLGRRGRWIYVWFYDHAVGIPRTGWVFGRNLRELERPTWNSDEISDVISLGAKSKEFALQTAGGALSSGDVAELLGVSVAAVKQRQRRGGLLAIPLANGEWGYPARQFAPDGRMRAGLRDVLAAFGPDEDPWVILSFLANPDPVSGEGIAFDTLDDPLRTRALVELARTFWEQGAT